MSSSALNHRGLAYAITARCDRLAPARAWRLNSVRCPDVYGAHKEVYTPEQYALRRATITLSLTKRRLTRGRRRPDPAV
ncbi:hypothetical protein EVAR_39472_1 [Eumeta japonica]|uniref:Uncharacterized protein n=1 Tax=Eumeta variegata TaxID=151549 RepID=A0A4C1W2P2_EUMVA|nr:hypothetical protein EVAR_39472_1 [Eumeta japonica]